MPSPSTTGGSLMGYPTTVDTGQVQPFALYTDDITVLTGASLTAGQAYFSSIILYAPVTVTQMRCDFTNTVAGNCDMGIYDATGTNGAPGNLLGHTGAIAAVSGLFTQNLTANLSLSPGRYWLAWVDTAADQIANRSSVIIGIGVLMKTSATNLTVLPATAGAVVDSLTRVGVMALLSGSFS